MYCLDYPTLNPPFNPQTALDPSTGQRYFAPGRLYSVVFLTVTHPPTWNAAYFRQLWRLNLFFEGSL